MDINFPFLLSQILNFVVIITPIILIVLIIISSTRRLGRIEDHLAALVEEVNKLTASKDL